MPINAIYSVQTNLTCIVLLIIIKHQMNKRTASYSSADMLFNMCTTVIVALCSSDMIYGFLDKMDFPGVLAILEVSNMVYFECITLLGFMWMIYVLVRLGELKDFRDKKLILWAAPLIIFTGILLSNHWNHMIFFFDENNVYQRGPLIVVHWILTWPYLLVITGILIHRIYIEKNRVKMTEAKILLTFIIAPFISSVLQMIFNGMSITQVGMTVSVMVVYVATLNRQIRRDELTGLNNNRAFRAYLGDQILKENVLTNLTIIMLDIDDFKNINDSYGHLEGDRALIYVANVLKLICGKSDKSLFLCRYAGDEFVIAGMDLQQNEIQELKSTIREELQAITHRNNVPYTVTMSIGHATAICSDNNEITRLMSQADMNMYNDKKEKKAR